MEMIAVRPRPALLAGLIVALLGCCAPAIAIAAPPGSETVDRTGTLQSEGQSMWAAGTGGAPGDRTLSLFDKSWSASGSAGSITHVEPSVKVCNIFKGKTVEKFFTEGSTSCEDEETIGVDIGDFGGEGSASTKGEIGLSLTLHGFASGSVGVKYPVTAHYTIPKRDSFAAGDRVTINTSESVDSGASLQTSFPTLSSAELDGVFGFHADASFNLCFFACTGEQSIFDFSLPEGFDGTNPANGQILEVPNPGTQCFDFIVNFVGGFGHAPEQYSRCHNAETGVNSGYLGLPDVTTSSSLNGDGSLSASGEDPYAVVPVSAVTWATRILPRKPPVPLNFGPAKIPGTEITLGWNTVQLLLTDIEAMRQNFTFKPRVDTTLSWGRSLEYTVLDSKGEVVGSGPGTGATFPLGDHVELYTPADLIGTLNVTPTLSMSKAEFSNHTENVNIGQGEFSALGLTLDTPKSGSVTLPDGKEFTPWPGSEIKLGPLVKKEFPLATTSNDLLNSSWTLGGFNEPRLGDLPLVPDPAPVPTPLTVGPVEGAPFSGTVASFADPDTTGKASDYTATIEWGDGATTAEATIVDDGEGVFHVTGTHTYAEEGTYPVTVTVQDTDTENLHATDNSTADVADAALHALAHTDTTTTGGQAALLWPAPPSSGTLASFTDDDPQGTLSDYSATVEWGDGVTTEGSIAPNGNGGWDVSGEHVYAQLGPHTVTVTVSDVGGSQVSTTLDVITYEFTPNGNFAIAPAEVGQPVEFWGARWPAENWSAPPAAFKGWAGGSETPPTCRGSWTGAPGDSLLPPASVPSYVAVLETGRVSKQGATLDGSIEGAAVVRTEPGYGSDPGHAGLGTVIAQICP